MQPDTPLLKDKIEDIAEGYVLLTRIYKGILFSRLLFTNILMFSGRRFTQNGGSASAREDIASVDDLHGAGYLCRGG